MPLFVFNKTKRATRRLPHSLTSVRCPLVCVYVALPVRKRTERANPSHRNYVNVVSLLEYQKIPEIKRPDISGKP